MQQKILILAAIPHGLRLDREIREIEEAIRRAIKRELFDIRIRTAIRPQDIRRAIAEERPQIVHFCGHGLEDGSLLLEDDRENNKPVSVDALALLFSLHTDYVNCVLLNACYSEKVAVAISQHIDYVIGMNQPIEDKAAIAFAQGFYDGLGYKTSGNQDAFQRAFDEGMVAIQMEKLSQGSIPVLKKKTLKNFTTEADSQNNSPSVHDSRQELRFEPNIKNPEPNKPTPPNPAFTKLKADYNQLRDLLAKKAWQEADQEMVRVILQVAKRQKEGWLKGEHIANFPCPDIHMIDQLWVEASRGKFGFSVQKNIWLSVDGQPGKFDAVTFRNFGDLVGWRVNDEWLRHYESFNFSLDAPKGHLPSLRFLCAEKGTNWLVTWQDNFKGFLTRIETCL
ncbi:MAG: GUN4 domain-containing protein [Nostochopsis sp.]